MGVFTVNATPGQGGARANPEGDWRSGEAAPAPGHNSGMTPEQTAEAISYLEAAAPARGSPEHFEAIRALIDAFQGGDVPLAAVKPSSIGALGNNSPLDRFKGIDASFAMAIARHRRSDLDTPTDIALMFFIKVHSDNKHGRCTESLSRMAAFANVDERTAQRRLRALRGAGLIGEEPRSGKPTAYWLTYDAVVVHGSAYDVICAIAPSAARSVGRPSKTPLSAKMERHPDDAPFTERGRQQGSPYYQNGATDIATTLAENGRHSQQKGVALSLETGDSGCHPAPAQAPAIQPPAADGASSDSASHVHGSVVPDEPLLSPTKQSRPEIDGINGATADIVRQYAMWLGLTLNEAQPIVAGDARAYGGENVLHAARDLAADIADRNVRFSRKKFERYLQTAKANPKRIAKSTAPKNEKTDDSLRRMQDLVERAEPLHE
jgi:hypothetical protein